jgi:hypothetical protein
MVSKQVDGDFACCSCLVIKHSVWHHASPKGGSTGAGLGVYIDQMPLVQAFKIQIDAVKQQMGIAGSYKLSLVSN